MPKLLHKTNIDSEIKAYWGDLARIKQQVGSATDTMNAYDFMEYVKREPIGVGPYPGVSLFESSNRVFSDLVILLGVKSLLYEHARQFPFGEYLVTLGNGQGMDVTANSGKRHFAGEAFNVAKSFFDTKLGKTRQALLAVTATHKLIMFNADACSPSRQPLSQDSNGLYMLAVDVGEWVVSRQVV